MPIESFPALIEIHNSGLPLTTPPSSKFPANGMLCLTVTTVRRVPAFLRRLKVRSLSLLYWGGLMSVAGAALLFGIGTEALP
jgi:hypothetical protein